MMMSTPNSIGKEQQLTYTSDEDDIVSVSSSFSKLSLSSIEELLIAGAGGEQGSMAAAPIMRAGRRRINYEKPWSIYSPNIYIDEEINRSIDEEIGINNQFDEEEERPRTTDKEEIVSAPSELLPSSFSMEEQLIAAVKKGIGMERGRNTNHNHDKNNKSEILSIATTKTNNDDHAILTQRIQDFRKARQFRKDRGDHSTISYGIFGLFVHLSEVRLDLDWAEHTAQCRAQGEIYLRWKDFEFLHKRKYHFPVFTYTIVLMSTIMLLYEISLNGWRVEPLHDNLMLGPSQQVLLDAGALHAELIVGQENQWYRLFIPMIMHAGIIHFILNMVTIWIVGGAVEKVHGIVITGFLFIISSVGGNILSATFQPFGIGVGASGGIFGLTGACLADILKNWDLVFISRGASKGGEEEKEEEEEQEKKLFCTRLMVPCILALQLIFNIIIGLTPFVDNFAQLGGLFYGICCATPVIDRVGKKFVTLPVVGMCGKIENYSLRLLGLALSFFILFMNVVVLAQSDGVTVPCPNCLYATCVPFPFWTNKDLWWDCSNVY